MCVDIKRRSKKSKLSKLKNCNNYPDNSFNSFALRKLKNQNQLSSKILSKCCVLKSIKYLKLILSSNETSTYQKPLLLWKNVKKASKSVLVLVCVQWNLMIFTTSSVMVVNEKFRKENERWWPSSRAPLMKCVVA